MNEKICKQCDKLIPSEDFEFCPYCGVLILDKNHLEYFNQGIKYHKQGKNKEAIVAYTRALALNPEDADIYFNRGNVYHDIEEYESALKDYSKAIELNPNDSNLYNNRGIVYYDIAKYDKALDNYNKAIELNPNDPDVYTNRAQVYRQLEENEKAFDDYEKSIKLLTNDDTPEADNKEEEQIEKLCKKCGKKIPLDYIYCNKCGYKF